MKWVLLYSYKVVYTFVFGDGVWRPSDTSDQPSNHKF